MSTRHKRRQHRFDDKPEEPTPSPFDLSSTDQLEQEVPAIEPTSFLFEPEHSVVIAPETSYPVDVPVVSEKEEVEVVEKKPKRKRKAKSEPADGSDGVSTAAPAPPPKKSKKDQLCDDFVMNELPALRKEMKLMKKEQSSFDIKEFSEYFKPGSKWTATYCARLFYFLKKNEIVCSAYGVFRGNTHMVKTIDGYNHCCFLASACGAELTAEDSAFMFRRFGKEWFKIPQNDEERVKIAVRKGEKNYFKVILTGLYEGSFFGENRVTKEKEEIFTINPILRYEPYIPPTPKAKKEKKTSEPTSSQPVDQAPADVSEIL